MTTTSHSKQRQAHSSFFKKSFKLQATAMVVIAGSLGVLGCESDKEALSGSANLDFSPNNFYGGSMAQKTLSLTFDDGPSPHTMRIANFLSERNIKGTFYVVGKNAAVYQDVLQKLNQMGHLVANHSWSHVAMSTAASPYRQVADTDAQIARHVPGRNFLFRAPYGDWRSFLANSLNNAGLTKYVGPIFWDVGGDMSPRYAADWACWGRGLSVSNCGQGYLNEIRDKRKGIVLMHDVARQTASMVEWLVPKLMAEGYSFQRNDLVPGIAAKLRQAGATPGAGIVVEPPRDLSSLHCGERETPSLIGSRGVLCRVANEAVGPFTAGMRQECQRVGGGSACGGDSWSWSFASRLYGTQVCPRGASQDQDSEVCVEGNNAIGPFPKALVNKCLALATPVVATDVITEDEVIVSNLATEPTPELCNSKLWDTELLEALKAAPIP